MLKNQDDLFLVLYLNSKKDVYFIRILEGARKIAVN